MMSEIKEISQPQQVPSFTIVDEVDELTKQRTWQLINHRLSIGTPFSDIKTMVKMAFGVTVNIPTHKPAFRIESPHIVDVEQAYELYILKAENKFRNHAIDSGIDEDQFLNMHYRPFLNKKNCIIKVGTYGGQKSFMITTK